VSFILNVRPKEKKRRYYHSFFISEKIVFLQILSMCMSNLIPKKVIVV
jgi:hypothetical protein